MVVLWWNTLHVKAGKMAVTPASGALLTAVRTGHAVLVARRFVGRVMFTSSAATGSFSNWNARADLEDVHNVAIDQATLPLYRYKRRRWFICTSTIITAEADAIAGPSASLVEAYRNAFSMPVASALNSALLLRLCY
jgi:hypothetical protein